MVGIDDVARRAGVSTATVSRALSGRGHVAAATRERVEEAAAELGYVVSASASSLATGRMRNIGVVVPFLNRWFYTSVLEGAQRRLMQYGYDLTLYNLSGSSNERSTVFEQFLLRQRVDAVIAVSLELSAEEVDSLHALGKPLVGVGGPIRGVPTVSIDDVGVTRLATEHLLSLGHTVIGHIGGDVDAEMSFHMPTNRRLGWEDALRDAGVEPRPELYFPAVFTMESGYVAAKQMLGDPRLRPTAVVVASDEMAIGVILAARDMGLDVPRDLSVVGIDDHELASFFGLTTVAQFPEQQGERAVELLMRELEQSRDDEPSNLQLPFELVVRSSTSRPRPDRESRG
ncbi:MULTISPECIES: LacI family DNA-binding transcriptional regulator [unclassified Microcella]|uniref:LacI family DNA-binding transcriptional regulator n=1 Tax=unclassified Microcella TaxID=2630066 RepID=UPI0006FEB21F|nr:MULTISPECIES: LacI family DNA-binding transcriptional regulator [unclassified Microcella]KQV25702.1 LacI family transcriptional regulator [Yonghaparkia sp. Root332]KRF33487.1 LacI family transcriptional regulator [Yonghaparkia sp. Soil809]